VNDFPYNTKNRVATVVSGTRIFAKLLALFLCACLLAHAEGNTFTKVRYNGGSVPSKVSPHDWDNRLTVMPDAITLEFKDGVTVVLPPTSVSTLSYGQEAHRRVGTMVALAILVAPVALFGLFYKTRLHFIGIQYNTPDGKHAGILLQGDKDNYRAILVALQGVTGAPVSVAEKEREFLPVGLTTSVTKDSAEGNTANQGSAPSPMHAETAGTVNVTSNPDGADIYVDGQFVGNAPSSLKLKAGKHEIRVSCSGHQDWSREIAIQSDSSAQLNAVLDGNTSSQAQGAGNSSGATQDHYKTTNAQEPNRADESALGVWFVGNRMLRHDGVEISGVKPGGPADSIGLKPGDRILSIAGRYLYTIDELDTELLRHGTGSRVEIRYQRNTLITTNFVVLLGNTPVH
jgi:hypothetical protein